MRLACHVILSLLVLLSGSMTGAAAAERGRVLFVVDSTAYMGALFGGSSKLVAVSNALASVWPNHAGRLDLGLAIYGRGSSGKSACTDSERRRAFAPLDGPGAAALLAGLKTKGDAGVAYALSKAVAGKDILAGRTSLIMIVGGPESCEADPCELAARIGGERDLPVHVIALDAGGEATQLQSLKCIADSTKGNYWQVGSTMELAAALDDALALAGKPVTAALRPGAAASNVEPGAAITTGSGTTASAGEVTASLDGAAGLAVPGNGPPGQVNLLALLTDAGPAVTSGLTWRVFVRNGTGLKQVLSSSEANPALTLPSGDYLINVAYGRSYATRNVKVAEGTANAQLVLNAGGLKLGARLADGSLAPVQFVSAEIFADERDQFGNRAKLVDSVRPGVIVRLNSGLYHVAATYGDANATVQSDVAVEAGRITDATVTFTAARVTFRLVQQSGGEALTGTSWTILGGAGETVKKSLAALPTHILAPGDYSVAAERSGKQYTQDFTVKAGEAVQVEVVVKE